MAGSALTEGGASLFGGDTASVAGIYPSTVDPAEAADFVTSGASSFENGTAPAGLAQSDLGAAEVSIAALTPTRESPLFSNETLTPGVYAAPSGTALAITVGLVLDAGGDPNARFIFRTDTALNIDASIVVSLINGAQERNVYWLVGTALTIGANADVPGNFLVVSAATLGANAIIRGSHLAQSFEFTRKSLDKLLRSWAALRKFHTSICRVVWVILQTQPHSGYGLQVFRRSSPYIQSTFV